MSWIGADNDPGTDHYSWDDGKDWKHDFAKILLFLKGEDMCCMYGDIPVV
jgi:hypothetical protein